MNAITFSHATDEWATPEWLYDSLDRIFHFTLNAAASADNARCARYFTREQDGLAQDWTGEVIFCNPPYSEVGKWVRKAFESAATTVLLVPARTSTKWWHAYATRGEVVFLCGRLRFGGGKNVAPFASAILVFGRNTSRQKSYIKQCAVCDGFFTSARAHARTRSRAA